MGGTSSNAAIVFGKTSLFANVDVMRETHMKAIAASGKLIEQEGVAYAKQNAPWTDQTGNARNGLAGATDVKLDSVTVYFMHQVPYGIYLETRWSGRYQIINPTIQVMAPRWMNLLRSMIFKGS